MGLLAGEARQAARREVARTFRLAFRDRADRLPDPSGARLAECLWHPTVGAIFQPLVLWRCPVHNRCVAVGHADRWTWLSRRREKRGGDWRRAARAALRLCGIYLVANFAISQFDRAGNTAFVETISSPPPLAFWERESIGVSGSGSFFVDGERIGNTPLAACNLAAARAQSEQVDAFLFWSRAPVITKLADGSYLLGDARYYGVEDGGFSVTLPDGLCSEPGGS